MGTGVAWVYSVVATLAPGVFPAAFRGADGRSRSISRRRRSSPCWCCSDRCWSCARASRPAAPSGRCSISRPRPRAASGRRRDEESRSKTSRSAITCACVRARRCRSTANSSRAQRGRRIHGHRRIDAGRQRSAGDEVIGGTLNQSGGFVMRAEKVGRDTMLAQIVQMVAERSAPARRSSASRIRSSGWFVPLVIVAAVARLRRLGDLRARAALRLRAGRRGRGADHRLPVRARPGDADVDHGRRRPRRAAGRADQERGGLGADGEGRHAGRRQDRHADRGQADGRRRSSRPEDSAKTSAAARGEPRASQRASAGRGDRRAAAERSISHSCEVATSMRPPARA